MTKIFFEGFQTGAAVALSAVQGGYNASGSVPSWGQGALGSVDILQVTPSELVAPVGIWFEAIGISGFDVTGPGPGEVYDPTAHAITWIWDFDDPGPFTAPLNMPSVWNEKGIDYGKKAYHVFDTPGTYNVRLWGVDSSGTTAEHIVPVTVLDPDAVYPGIRTICVSQAGDFAGAPAGANLVTSLAAARTALEQLGQTGRILLRAGEDFVGTLNPSYQMKNFRIGSFGAGAKPTLRAPTPAPGGGGAPVIFWGNAINVPDSCLYGLRFPGEWDASRETGDPRFTAIGYTTRNAGYFNDLIYQCEFDGLGGQYFDTFANHPYTQAVVDCDFTNWRDYGLYIGTNHLYTPGKRFALVGTAIHQKVNACRGGLGKIGMANDHGPMRHTDILEVLVSTCDFYSANSWAAGVQPCVRFCQSDQNSPGGYFLNVNRIACEGGNIGGIDGQNGIAVEAPGNHVIDKFLFVQDYSSTGGFLSAFGGTTLRNGIAVRLAMTYQNPPIFMLDFTTNSPSPENPAAPMDIHNCTLVNLDATAVPNMFQNLGNFLNATAENNIIHEPGAGNTPAAPLSLANPIAGFTPRNAGERVSIEKVVQPVGSVAPGQSVAVPYPAGTSAADFSPGGRHTVRRGGKYYFSYRGECSLSFGPGDITVTNTSADTWTSDVQLGLDRETLTTNTALASPASVPMPEPQAGSNALLDEGGLLARMDFLTELRDGPWKGAL